MSDIAGPYVNHADAATDGAGNVYAIYTQDGPQSGDVDVVVKRCDASADIANGANWREVARFTERECGKHGYGSGVFVGRSFVALLSERNAAGETVARVRVLPELGEDAPASEVGGGEVYTSAPGGYIRVFSRASAFEGGATIDLPDSIPVGVVGLHLRIMARAGAADRRAFVGTNTDEGAALPCYLQVAGVRNVMEGRRAPSPQHTLAVSVPYGAVAELYIDVLGWWYA